MKLTKAARKALSRQREGFQTKNKQRLMGGALGLVGGLAARDRIPEIGGVDGAMVISAYGLFGYKPTGKWGHYIQGAMVGFGVPSSVEFASEQIVPAVQERFPQLLGDAGSQGVPVLERPASQTLNPNPQIG